MRLASWRSGDHEQFGVVVDRSVVDVSAWSGYASLADLLAAGPPHSELHRAVEDGDPQDIDAVTLLPPIPAPRKIFAIGANYRSHIEEVGRPMPTHPVVFVRFPDSFVGHRQPIVSPTASPTLDWEGELAVVIGEPCVRVRSEDAKRVIAGSTCCAENSVREFQFHGSQVTPGKNFASSGALGPWLVTVEELDPRDLAIRTRIGDDVVQSDQTSNMVFDIPTIVAYLSSFTPLAPGDLIATGTPAGVGEFREPKRYLAPGDLLSVEIEGIGTLTNPVVQDTAA